MSAWVQDDPYIARYHRIQERKRKRRGVVVQFTQAALDMLAQGPSGFRRFQAAAAREIMGRMQDQLAAELSAAKTYTDSLEVLESWAELYIAGDGVISPPLWPLADFAAAMDEQRDRAAGEMKLMEAIAATADKREAAKK